MSTDGSILQPLAFLFPGAEGLARQLLDGFDLLLRQVFELPRERRLLPEVLKLHGRLRARSPGTLGGRARHGIRRAQSTRI